ncbi:hypothetical protein WJX72_011607 [[Myrmecia] bisecta]|uniref:Tudor domain-containing protein n=1 Tax=[Myrmecia] bisecta TaxID=41462 RepID=A0AAW1PMJ9_9CHLO
MAAEVAQRIEELREEAYAMVIRCFKEQTFDWKKMITLGKVQSELQISDDLARQIKEAMDNGTHHTLGVGTHAHASPSRAPQHEHPPSMAPPLAQKQRPSSSNVTAPSSFSHAGGAGPGPAGKRSLPAGPSASKANKKRKALADALLQPGGAGAAPRPASKAGAPAPHKQSSLAHRPILPGPAGPADVALKIDELVGRRVKRFWSDYGGWYDGIISDYDGLKGEHCIVYDMGLASESFEWYNVRDPENKHECKLVEGPKVDVLSHQPPAMAADFNQGMAAGSAGVKKGKARTGPSGAFGHGRGGGNQFGSKPHKNGQANGLYNNSANVYGAQGKPAQAFGHPAQYQAANRYQPSDDDSDESFSMSR